MTNISHLQIIFGILSSAFILVGFLPYLRDINQRKARPHILSWTGWGFVTGLGAVAMFTDTFNLGAIVVAANSVLCFSIAAYSWVKKIGVWKASFLDYWFFIAGIIGLILWQVFDNPDLAITFAVIADLSFGLPTLIKIYKDPSSETVFPWSMAALSGVTSLLAVSYLSYTEVAYPVYLTIYDLCAFGLIVYGQRLLRRGSSLTKEVSEVESKF